MRHPSPFYLRSDRHPAYDLRRDWTRALDQPHPEHPMSHSPEALAALHPSIIAPGEKAKIRRLSDGIVLERWAPDARDIVASGAYEFVGRDTESARERLETMGPDAVFAFSLASGVQPGSTSPEATTDTIGKLLARIEAGTLTLPEAA